MIDSSPPGFSTRAPENSRHRPRTELVELNEGAQSNNAGLEHAAEPKTKRSECRLCYVTKRPVKHKTRVWWGKNQLIKSAFDSIGRVTSFGARALRDAWFPPFEPEYLGTQLYEIGVGSFLLVVASGFALGVVLTPHTRGMMVQFGATADVPVFQSLAFFNEIGPLVTGLPMAGRVDAGIGAQLASMRATEQIDAIETVSINSFKLLVVTRVIACTLMLPLLTVFMDAAGVLGGFVSEHFFSHLSWTLYLERAFNGVALANLIPPALKTAVFGYLIAAISCFYGYTTNEGSEGVRKAARHNIDVAIGQFNTIYGNTLVIEGYSSLVSASDQLIQSRRRATLVQTYLRLRFHVLHKNICVVALNGTPPGNAGKSTCDGVSLVSVGETRSGPQK